MKDWLTALCPEIGQWRAELIEEEVTRWRANDKALMQQALAALIELQHGHARTVAPGIQPVIDALRAALGESK